MTSTASDKAITGAETTPLAHCTPIAWDALDELHNAVNHLCGMAYVTMCEAPQDMYGHAVEALYEQSKRVKEMLESAADLDE